MRPLALLVLTLSPALAAQDGPGPRALLEAKLASPFLSRADWTTDYDEALRRARVREQLVLGYFTTAGP